jgi:hypothetical protein
MAIYYPLSWQNENALSGYPFDSSIFSNDFIVDAKFIQFDGFIPTLNYVIVDADKILLSLTLDYGELSNLSYKKSDYISGQATRQLRIYTPDGNRYLGVLVFGSGLEQLWLSSVGRKYTINSKFSSSTIISIPKKAGVYSLDNLKGSVQLSKTAEDRTIFYNASKSPSLNSLTFNAVYNHEISGEYRVLRKINLVSPVDNNINLSSNDIVKIYSPDNDSLKIELASGAASKAFIIPTLIA